VKTILANAKNVKHGAWTATTLKIAYTRPPEKPGKLSKKEGMNMSDINKYEFNIGDEVNRRADEQE
jgi:hypothetical protein